MSSRHHERTRTAVSREPEELLPRTPCSAVVALRVPCERHGECGKRYRCASLRVDCRPCWRQTGTTLFAAIRCIEIIGEAAARVSAATRDSAPDVPWNAILGMRNRLVPAYFDVDADFVWKTISVELPDSRGDFRRWCERCCVESRRWWDGSRQPDHTGSRPAEGKFQRAAIQISPRNFAISALMRSGWVIGAMWPRPGNSTTRACGSTGSRARA